MNILDEHLHKEEIDLSNEQFRGKLAGKAWKLEQHDSKVEMSRVVIFGASFLIFVSIILNYLFHNTFSQTNLIFGLFLALIFIACGILFKKYTVGSILIALLLQGVIILEYLSFPESYSLRWIALIGAIFILIGSGLIFHFKAKKLRSELIEEVRKQRRNKK